MEEVTYETETSLTKYVLVSHQDGLVDLRLSGPTGLIGGEENFNGHLLSPPPAHPHLSIPPLPYLLHHLDLLGYRSLHLKAKRRNGVVLSSAFKHPCVFQGLVTPSDGY